MEHFLRISLTGECQRGRFSAFTNSEPRSCSFRMLAVSHSHYQELFWNWRDLSDFSALSDKFVSIHVGISIRIVSLALCQVGNRNLTLLAVIIPIGPQ